MESEESTPSLLSRLRGETRALHEAAERVPYMRALAQGTLPREAYAGALPQLRMIRQRLEQSLRDFRDTVPEIAATIHDYHFTAEAFDRDMEWFGASDDGVPDGGTRDFLQTLEELEKRDPVLVLGMFYVLEGSNMGAAYLRKKVQELYATTDEGGTASMNVHGSQLGPRWKEFVGTLDALDLTDDQRDGIVDAAKRTFDAVGRLYLESYRPEGANAA